MISRLAHLARISATPASRPSVSRIASQTTRTTSLISRSFASGLTTRAEDTEERGPGYIGGLEVAFPPEQLYIPGRGEAVSSPDHTSQVLDEYNSALESRSKTHLGYPYNLTDQKFSRFGSFLNYTINNLGDPYISSNYGIHSRPFETAVLDFFARLWEADRDMENDPFWGCVTACGTEGNLQGLLLARERHPDGIILTSEDTHYSIFKAAHAYRMDHKKVRSLPTGAVDCDDLERHVAEMASEGRDIILNVNIGTTVKGGIDDLDEVVSILERQQIPREKFHIHLDGALSALMLPFAFPHDEQPRPSQGREGRGGKEDVVAEDHQHQQQQQPHVPVLSFDRYPIDSIAVSGHKMLGCPMPCGVIIVRKRHVERIQQHIEYLNSPDTTLMGSRNGHAALLMWFALRSKGVEGIAKEVKHCLENAEYMHGSLRGVGIKAYFNKGCNTVTFPRPRSEALIQKWQLACQGDIAHVVVMPNVERDIIDEFVDELLEDAREEGGETEGEEDEVRVMGK